VLTGSRLQLLARSFIAPVSVFGALLVRSTADSPLLLSFLTARDSTTSGDTSSADNSSFHGLNAAVLAAGGSTINLSDSTITTSGSGANGAFATEAGSTVNLTKVTIQAAGDGGHAVMATNGGAMMLVGVDMTTAGPHSGAIATDRGGGTITVSGGAVTTSGQDSPGVYSTGAPWGISGSVVTNITGNGHTVTYDASACPALGDKIYTLNGGGQLKPSN
jgi:hypothetical protein